MRSDVRRKMEDTLVKGEELRVKGQILVKGEGLRVTLT